MNVKSRLHRTIKNFENYHELNDENSKLLLENLDLLEDEVCYGVYENTPEKKEERIAITNKGLCIWRKNEWVRIYYLDIKEIRMEENKQTIDSLTLILLNDVTFQLPIKGHKGKFKDIFNFTRFLDRVISDLKKQG